MVKIRRVREREITEHFVYDIHGMIYSVEIRIVVHSNCESGVRTVRKLRNRTTGRWNAGTV